MQQREYRLAAVMFTDIQGFSRMMERDERGTLELLDYQNELVTRLASERNGRVIKTIGDALLVEFNTTLDAVQCGVAVQNALADFNRSSGKAGLQLRIGIHLGDIHFSENDALGEGINIASRLQSIAYPGCICISQEVYHNVVNKIEADIRDLGRVELKNITKEIRAYEIVTPAAVGYSRPPVSSRALADQPPGPPPKRAEAASPWRSTVEDSSPTAPGPSSPERQRSSAGQPPPEGPNAGEFEELKSFVVQQIKRVGRRVSVERVRSLFPNPGPEFEEALERLADMGFLTREGSRDGATSGPQRGGPFGSSGSGPWAGGGPWVGGSDAWGGSHGFDREAMRAARDQWREAAHQARHAAHEARHAVRHAGEHGVADEMGDQEWAAGASYEEFRARVIDRAAKARGGLTAHLTTYLLVNAGLAYLNLTIAGPFHWFLIPLLGWGIGVVSHLVGVVTRQTEKRDVEELPEHLEEPDYKLLRRFHHSRSSARGAAASLIMVAVLLGTINILTSPHFAWALFPIAGLAIGFVSSTATYLAKRGGFLKRIRELKRNKRAIDSRGLAHADAEEDPAIVQQAAQIAEAILTRARELDPDSTYLGEDMKPLLESYIGQVRRLARKSREVEEIMATIPRGELRRDLESLRSRYEQATSAALKAEYKRSIEQIEHENRSFEELTGQKELLDLKVASSLTSLKQMQLDIARVAGMTAAHEPSQLDRLRSRTRELSEHLQDLGTSYAELEGLPAMGERERAEADRLLADFKAREAKGEKGGRS